MAINVYKDYKSFVYGNLGYWFWYISALAEIPISMIHSFVWSIEKSTLTGELIGSSTLKRIL